MPPTPCVYGLIDPRTDALRYIGKTTVEEVAKAMHDELMASPAVLHRRTWGECDYADQVRLACSCAQAMRWRGELVVWAT